MTARKILSFFIRTLAAAALLASSQLILPAHADPAPFDLSGPKLRISVTRDGITLPIGAVPGLAGGDRLLVAADLPDDQRVRFLLIAAFLDGATNPPPKKWIHTAETWKARDKDNSLTLTVPGEARQLVLFLVPDTGGASGAIAKAVRARPGEFVRATQALNQASLDRSRLDAFVGAIRAQDSAHPEFLKSTAPALARSLALKLKAECLTKMVEFQASCLVEDREALVLADVHSSSIAETLLGAPTDLALQLSYTREAGFGQYSPYIAVARDIARVFGAFSSPQFRYLPALSLRDGEQVSLMLNAAPSFAKPLSVLVASMPAIGGSNAPRLRGGTTEAICGARAGAVFPVEGAPLIYSTGYAREMRVRLTSSTGKTADWPVVARPDRGGYVLEGTPSTVGFSGEVEAHLHGFWGFDAIEGPIFRLQFPGGGRWRTSRDSISLVLDRDNQVELTGPAAACVEAVSVRTAGAAPIPVRWKPAGADGLSLTVPLAHARPGDVTIEIRQYGAGAPSTLVLPAYREMSRLDALALHAGDNAGMLSGQRLDQVAAVQIGSVRLKPDGLQRDGAVDRLRLTTGPGQALEPGPVQARVALTDGRSIDMAVTILPGRPAVSVLAKSLRPKAPMRNLFSEFGDGLLPDMSTLVFSVGAGQGTRLLPDDQLEIATEDGRLSARLSAGSGLRLESPEVMVASFDPASLGPSAAGPLKFRLLRAGGASDWQPLTRLVRLPEIEAVDCTATTCSLRGKALFLMEAIAPSPGFESPVVVPRGFTGASVSIPAPPGGALYVRLRDAADRVVRLTRD